MLTGPERKNKPHARDIPPRGGPQHPFWSCWGALGDPGFTSHSLGVILGLFCLPLGVPRAPLEASHMFLVASCGFSLGS